MMNSRKLLTAEQCQVLNRIDRTREIQPGDEKICLGLHFCPDWDFMPICDDSPEKDACTCEDRKMNNDREEAEAAKAREQDALRELRAMERYYLWRPIKDAPRDGRVILAISKLMGAVVVKWFKCNGEYAFRDYNCLEWYDLVLWADINVPDAALKLEMSGAVTKEGIEDIVKVLGPLGD